MTTFILVSPTHSAWSSSTRSSLMIRSRAARTVERVLTPGQKLLEQPNLGRVCLGGTQPGCKILGGVQPVCGLRLGAGLSDHRQSQLGRGTGARDFYTNRMMLGLAVSPLDEAAAGPRKVGLKLAQSHLASLFR
jgi:hypothetical protein